MGEVLTQQVKASELLVNPVDQREMIYAPKQAVEELRARVSSPENDIKSITWRRTNNSTTR